VRVFKGEEVAA